MEFLIERFSVIKNEIKAREQKKKDDLRKLRAIDKDDGATLGLNSITLLVEQGFSIDQIIFINKEFKVQSISAAVLLMTKDTLTGKYNHTFYSNDLGVCKVCLDSDKEAHISSSFAHVADKEITLKPISKSATNEKTKKDNNAGFNPLNDNSKVSNWSSTSNHQNNLLEGSSPIKINKEEKDYSIKEDVVPLYNDTTSKIKNLNYVKISDLPSYDFEDPSLCEICWDEKFDPESNNRGCQHRFCKKCIVGYLTNKIENGNVLKIKCLYGGCPSLFTDADITHYTNPTLFRKYKKFKYEQLRLTERGAKYVYCPYIDCGCMVNIKNFIDDTEVSCDNGHAFCGKCQKDVHPGYSCIEVNQNVLEQIRSNLKDKKSVNLCPNCNVIIEKLEGCNHLECSNCLHEFCWLCMKPYEKGHYSYFNFSGCPGLEHYDPSSSSEEMWNSCWCKILSFFLALILAVLILGFFFFFGLCYEFVVLYTNKKVFDEEGEVDEDSETQYDENGNIIEKKYECSDYVVLTLIIIAGIALQPLYLMFYIMWGFMWFIKEYGWWCFIADYSF